MSISSDEEEGARLYHLAKEMLGHSTDNAPTPSLQDRIHTAASSKGRIITLEMKYTDGMTGNQGTIHHPIHLSVLEITSPMIHTMVTSGMEESIETEKTDRLCLEDPKKGRENPVPRKLLEVSTFLRMISGERTGTWILPWSSQFLLRYIADMYDVPIDQLVDNAGFASVPVGTTDQVVPDWSEDILTFLLVENQGISFNFSKDRILHLEHVTWSWVTDRVQQGKGDFLSLPSKLQESMYKTIPAATRLFLLRRWGRALALSTAPHFTGMTGHLLVNLHAQPFGNHVIDVLPPEIAKNLACDWPVSDPEKERPVGSLAFCDTAEEAIAALEKEWTVVESLRNNGLLCPGGQLVVSGGAVLRALGILSPDLPRSDLDLFVTPGIVDYRDMAMLVVRCVAEHYREGRPASVCKMWIRGAIVYIEVALTRHEVDETGTLTTIVEQPLQIQVIAYSHILPILGFDWDCCAIQFDGSTFQTTYPGLVSLLTRQAGRFNTKGIPHLDRALKMFDRGFAVPLHSLLTDTGLLLPSKYSKAGQKRKREDVTESETGTLMDDAIKVPTFFDAVLASARFEVDKEHRGRQDTSPTVTDDPLRIFDATSNVEVLCTRMRALDTGVSDLQYRPVDSLDFDDGESLPVPVFASAEVVDGVTADGFFHRVRGGRVQVAFTFDTVRCSFTRFDRSTLFIRIPTNTPLGRQQIKDLKRLDLHCSKKLIPRDTGGLFRIVELDVSKTDDAFVDGITSHKADKRSVATKFTGTITIVRSGPTSVHIARIAVFPQKMRRKALSSPVPKTAKRRRSLSPESD